MLTFEFRQPWFCCIRISITVNNIQRSQKNSNPIKWHVAYHVWFSRNFFFLEERLRQDNCSGVGDYRDHSKWTGGSSSEILKEIPKTCKMYQGLALWAWLEIVFTPSTGHAVLMFRLVTFIFAFWDTNHDTLCTCTPKYVMRQRVFRV